MDIRRTGKTNAINRGFSLGTRTGRQKARSGRWFNPLTKKWVEPCHNKEISRKTNDS